MIRITGGEAKGRMLKVYRGGQVRPTSDKVRQAIFNVLEHRFDLDFEDCCVLDLFAGSGSLGAEALSRGASTLLAIEADAKTLSVLKSNLDLVQASIAGRKLNIQVNSKKVERFLKSAPQRTFNLIFADPPYREHLGPQLLDLLAQGWIDDEAVIIIEHEKHDQFAPPYGWVLDDRRLYGDTFVSFLSRLPALNKTPNDIAH